MQVYHGMDLGTAKPSKKQQADIPHHLIDVVEIDQPFNAALFVTLARQAVAEIQRRGRLPIFCGGTGLYFKVLLEGLGEAPPANKVLRAELESIPEQDLLRELAQADPVTFQRIDQRNRRRVIRAIEVIRLTEKPYSLQQADWQKNSDTEGAKPRLIVLTRPAAELHRRIESRVESMFRAGLVKETESLLARGLSENPTAMQALGYRQVVEYLRGERTLAQTIERVKIRTRQFAKRQMTWFKRQALADWISLGPDLEDNAAKIHAYLAYLTDARKKHLSSR
jgi:tRNA dimethylallyltransferase